MSLNPLAPAFLPLSQSSSDPPPSFCNSTAMSLPLAQIFCGMLPQIIRSHAPFIIKHALDRTLLLPLPRLTNRSKPNAAAHQPPPEPTALLSSLLQHQSNCLQAIHKTFHQFNQHLKAQHLDRQTLQLIVLHLQNDFALLRYLLFSNKDIATKDSATSPLLNPNSNPNPLPISSAFPLPGPGDTHLPRFTPVGAVGPPRTKTNKPANADLQPTPDTQEAPSTTVQNLTSRICKMEKLFTVEISTYTSITAGIHSQHFFYTIKFASLNLAIQMLSFGRSPQ